MVSALLGRGSYDTLTANGGRRGIFVLKLSPQDEPAERTFDYSRSTTSAACGSANSTGPQSADEAQIAMLECTALAAPIHVWLKINSGMNRAGFLPAAVDGAWQRLRASGKVADITLMTHFARADEPECGRTLEQLAAFQQARGEPPSATRTRRRNRAR